MKALLVVGLLAATVASAKELPIITGENGSRWTVDIDTYKVQGNLSSATVYNYSKGKRIKNVITVNCDDLESGQMMWTYETGRWDTFFWSAKGDRVYDGIGTLLCAVRPGVLDPA